MKRALSNEHPILEETCDQLSDIAPACFNFKTAFSSVNVSFS